MKTMIPLSLEQRQVRLTSLIEDCIKMGANRLLIKNYKDQLNGIVREIKYNKKAKRKKRKLKVGSPNTLIEVPNHHNTIFFVDLDKSPTKEDIERENRELYQNKI